MSDQDDYSQRQQGDDLLPALKSVARRTSAAHDRAVLAAAHSAAAARSARFSGRWPRWLAAGVSLAAVGAVAVTLFVSPSPPPDRLRGSATAVSPANDARLSSAPAELAWPAQPGATAYRVVLHDAAAQPVWRSETQAQTRLTLPADLVATIQPGHTYLWIVEVENGLRRELGPFSFYIGEGP